MQVITKDFEGWNGKERGEFAVQRLEKRQWVRRKNLRLLKAISGEPDANTIFLCSNWKMAVPCLLRSFYRPTKFFAAVHGLDAFETRPKNRLLQKATLRRSDGVLAVSNYTAGLLESIDIAPQKLRVIHNGVEVERFKPGLRNAEFAAAHKFGTEFRLLSVGRLVERKGFDMALRAIALLPSGIPLRYYLAGTGPYEDELRRLSRELGIDDKIRFLGFIDEADLPELYRQADLFIMPSRNTERSVEGFGIVYLEAAACRVPSVAGSGNGAEDAVRPDETGYLVNPESPQEIAAAIQRAVENPRERRQFGEKAGTRVEREFTWQHTVGNLLDFVRDRLDVK